MNQKSTYSIQNPLGIQTILSLGLLIALFIYGLINRNPDETNTMLYLLGCGWLVFCTAALAIKIVRSLRRPTSLEIRSEVIVINGKTIEAKQMNKIMVMGYFKPVVGIQPVKKKLVPLDLCFAFSINEEQGLQDIRSWAERNGVKVVNQHFMRWI